MKSLEIISINKVFTPFTLERPQRRNQYIHFGTNDQAQQIEPATAHMESFLPTPNADQTGQPVEVA
jgi:hypothetical protein